MKRPAVSAAQEPSGAAVADQAAQKSSGAAEAAPPAVLRQKIDGLDEWMQPPASFLGMTIRKPHV